MAKKAESTAWKEMERRLGASILEDGERPRPLYQGTRTNLRGTAFKTAPSRRMNLAEQMTRTSLRGTALKTAILEGGVEPLPVRPAKRTNER